MMQLILAAIAPVIIILVYIYLRDKWEKEPVRKLIAAVILGAFIVIPVYFLEMFLSGFLPAFNFSHRISAMYNAFVIAAFSEETFKFIVLYLLIWKSKEFNEKFDGIVYAVFVSLGFAMVENIMYVTSSGMNNAIVRAITAVPAHALFGVAMGYYLSFAKFSLFYKKRNMVYALLIPIGLHGIYDFILMSGEPMYYFVFIPYVYYLYKVGFKRIDELSNSSRFRK